MENPDNIRFCQSSIKDTFTTGENLLSVFIKIWDGDMDPNQMNRKVEVYFLSEKERSERQKKDGNQWRPDFIEGNCNYAVEGNRRLYIFKKLHEAGKLGNISVKRLQSIVGKQWKFTTKTKGRSIKFYKPYIPPDGRGVERRINDIFRRGNIEESDREFAKNYRTKPLNILKGGGSAPAEVADAEEDEVYYESDDDGS